ncbi:endolytic transglycosylase MltG, partial [bacterium]|nr:endolytic transglycosylase MltG [bacterium]
MRRRLKGNRLVLILLVLLAIDLVAVLWASWTLVPPGSGEKVLVKIPQGLSSTQIADSLEARGVLKGTRLFRLALRLGDDNLKAGRYLFRTPQAPGRVLSKLRRGATEKTWLRIPEGLWMDETVGLIARQLDLDSLKLSQQIRQAHTYNYEFLEGAGDLEGLLFPDSYAFEYPVSEEDVLPRLLGRCDEVLRRLRDTYSLEETGLSLREWIVLASIVEAETMLDSEREQVAAVYRNRLALGMKLEADPTVIYGLGVR